ncbi:MAG: tRNA uridine(34) 5-carboxymethylaminomethyl modification radical SAM/GNAT enzyme Elp3 [Anaerolineae bacterium]|nr:tRNA uridine(34) 5-carboxymethylaminomethyl modification radical SAM/GNAT enzyme Elp3 [Anaerolineae bacterium]MCO5199616.1 tRNA uridine(34) 5-carboxymethylaminomethyl modification radical SAM/GNAT enzyme Elp3 [Anaerolineae bacterium]
MSEDKPSLEIYGKNARKLEFVPVVDVERDDSAWQAKRVAVTIAGQEDAYAALLRELLDPAHKLTTKRYRRVMRRYAKDGLAWLTKENALVVYQQLCDAGYLQFDQRAIVRLQLKPTRSQAGVAVVTVLTKPFPCPGECIFCPTDVRMPKSYLHDEPGAQRAERHGFDPYTQTASRIATLARLGHPTDKIELLILGGTWSSYRRDYQEWFVKRCFDAMNGVESETLQAAQERNESAEHRNVGLVVETRQDHIDADELRWLRTLGVTKVQVGIQTMNERVLALNKRGHDAQATRDAFRLLRLAGFKIHGHWMANLLGATPASDLADYCSLWDDPAVRPDELKIYPCMLVENADLYAWWQRGEYTPYDEETLIELLVQCKAVTPRYTRLTRVIRDIPTTNVVEGNKKANLRQIAQHRMQQRGLRCQCIRCREIRRDQVEPTDLQLLIASYDTDATVEHFLSYETADERIAGFLRLSLPHSDQALPLPELAGHAMIREVHVYGPALRIGRTTEGAAQHSGLGSQLIDHAKRIAYDAGFGRMAVISAVGTRGYYAKHGFQRDGLYMTCPL